MIGLDANFNTLTTINLILLNIEFETTEALNFFENFWYLVCLEHNFKFMHN